jgi:hypothetical protein
MDLLETAEPGIPLGSRTLHAEIALRDFGFDLALAGLRLFRNPSGPSESGIR